MKLEKETLIKDFNRWLKSYMRNIKYREISENSMAVYSRILYKFREYLLIQDDIESLSEIDKDFIYSFLEWLEENSKARKFSIKTKTLYISILKSLFIYISDNNDELFSYEKEFKGI